MTRSGGSRRRESFDDTIDLDELWGSPLDWPAKLASSSTPRGHRSGVASFAAPRRALWRPTGHSDLLAEMEAEVCRPACTWIAATNADVARDRTVARYRSLLARPVGTEVLEMFNGRLWKLRVVSRTTDPGLTTFAKDVRGWICRPSRATRLGITQSTCSPAPFIVRLEDPGVTPQASEAAYGFRQNVVDVDGDGSNGPMVLQADGDFKMPSNGVGHAVVTQVERHGPHLHPVAFSLVSGGNAPLVPGITQTVQLATRLRFSLFDFVPSFIDRLTFAKNGQVTGVALNKTLLNLFHAARFDDYSLVKTITFDGERTGSNGKPTGDAKPPVWGDYAPFGQRSEMVRTDYLQKLTDEMHSHGEQVIVGYEMVEDGPTSTPVGQRFLNWLKGASSAQIAAHAQAIAQFFSSRNILIDGIGFDIELNGFGSAHGQQLGVLLAATANALSSRNGVVYYDNAPFQVGDGQGNIADTMKPLRFSLAAGAPNVVARPMCYDGKGNITPKPGLEASIACALRPATDRNGGGLHPSQTQFSLNWARVGNLGMLDLCSSVFRPNRVGVTLYTMPGSDQPRFLQGCVAWEAALNPGQSAPGNSGQPLQVPLL